jgi:hypothetical protein
MKKKQKKVFLKCEKFLLFTIFLDMEIELPKSLIVFSFVHQIVSPKFLPSRQH